MFDDLIKRLEAATEGSRKLDEAIALACGWEQIGEFNERWLEPGVGRAWNIEFCPEFSQSLDAALTLVSEGWTVARISQTDQKGWNVELREGYLSSYNRVIISPSKYNSPTPALAVCIAALRARQTLLGSTTHRTGE